MGQFSASMHVTTSSESAAAFATSAEGLAQEEVLQQLGQLITSEGALGSPVVRPLLRQRATGVEELATFPWGDCGQPSGPPAAPAIRAASPDPLPLSGEEEVAGGSDSEGRSSRGWSGDSDCSYHQATKGPRFELSAARSALLRERRAQDRQRWEWQQRHP